MHFCLYICRYIIWRPKWHAGHSYNYVVLIVSTSAFLDGEATFIAGVCRQSNTAVAGSSVRAISGARRWACRRPRAPPDPMESPIAVAAAALVWPSLQAPASGGYRLSAWTFHLCSLCLLVVDSRAYLWMQWARSWTLGARYVGAWSVALYAQPLVPWFWSYHAVARACLHGYHVCNAPRRCRRCLAAVYVLHFVQVAFELILHSQTT